MMLIRVYALYNRSPIILWVLGTHIAISFIAGGALVRAFFFFFHCGTPSAEKSFNALRPSDGWE